MKPTKKLVDKFFRNEVPTLMLGFDPWSLPVEIDSMQEKPHMAFFISGPFREKVLVPYAQNWQDVIDEYLTWQVKDFDDPVDQCKWIAKQVVDIFKKLFRNIEKDLRDPTFVNLYTQTALHVETLCQEILPWALTHKFIAENLAEVPGSKAAN